MRMRKLKIMNESAELFSFDKNGKTMYFVRPNAGEQNIQIWDDLETAQTKSKAPKLIKVKDFLKDLMTVDEWPEESDEKANIFNSMIDSMKVGEGIPSAMEDKEKNTDLKMDAELPEKPKEDIDTKVSTTSATSETPTTSGEKTTSEIKLESSNIKDLIKGLIFDIADGKISEAKKKTDDIIIKKIEAYTENLTKNI